jgi:lysophospholipase L1-like esterase
MRRVSAFVVILAISTVALIGQSTKSDNWVAAWSTAVVAAVAAPAPTAPAPAGRGQAPAPAPALQPAGPPQPTAPAAGVPTFPGAPAPAAVPPAGPPPPPAVRSFNNQTLRLIVQPTLGGDRLRIVLSNAFGTAPLVVGAAYVAVRDKESAIVANSARPLRFSGSAAATIPAGAVIISDPVDLTFAAHSDLAVDVYVPGDTVASGSPLTMHTGALQTSYVSGSGNYTGVQTFPVATTTASWFLLARVEVAAPPATGVIVTIGDSITDGTRSTPNTNKRWPNLFAKRLAQATGPRLAVVNAGIAGNRVLVDGAGPNILARFDRDVLAQTGVTHIIVLEGINDIGQGRSNPLPSAEDLIAGHRQLIMRAHARGLKIYGATLTPFEGAAYWTPEGEAKRAALNEWIRTSREYDGVIDFDLATRDPQQPTKFQSQYNSGDNLHPSDAGYQAMANAIDLSLFGVKATVASR